MYISDYFTGFRDFLQDGMFFHLITNYTNRQNALVSQTKGYVSNLSYYNKFGFLEDFFDTLEKKNIIRKDERGLWFINPLIVSFTKDIPLSLYKLYRDILYKYWSADKTFKYEKLLEEENTWRIKTIML